MSRGGEEVRSNFRTRKTGLEWNFAFGNRNSNVTLDDARSVRAADLGDSTPRNPNPESLNAKPVKSGWICRHPSVGWFDRHWRCLASDTFIFPSTSALFIRIFNTHVLLQLAIDQCLGRGGVLKR